MGGGDRERETNEEEEESDFASIDRDFELIFIVFCVGVLGKRRKKR